MYADFERESASQTTVGAPYEHGPDGQAPRHVVHFVSTFESKTDTKWLLQLARHVDRDAYRFSAVCFYGGGPVQERLEALGVRTFNLNTPDERDPRAVLRARKLIQELQPDIVHTHLLRADLMGGAAARWAGVPVVVSTVYAMGEFRRQKRRKADRLLDVACSRLATHTIAVSQAVADDLVERMRVDPEDLTVIHTGIEAPPAVEAGAVAAMRRAWGVEEATPVVLTIARLSYEKGVDTLIDLAAVLHPTNPAIRFVVVGEGEDRAALSEKIEQLGLKDIVKLVGFAADVWPALAAADVVCIPSKAEGMPNVLLEAMAMGRPIAATRVGGIPEVIESYINGVMVEPGRTAELAKAVSRLVGDAALRARLGDAARRTARERFDAAEVAGRYEDLYRRLLERRSIGSDLVTAAH